MNKVWGSLQFKIPTVFIISFLLIFLAVFVVFSTIGKSLLEKHAYKQATLSAQNIVSQLGNRIAFAESLAISLANLGEVMPANSTQNKKLIKHVLDVKGSEAFIAGGGIWPAAYKYNPEVERHSFFWGRDKNGVLKYYDDYNKPEGPGYHHEEWYVPAKYLEAGKSFWSKSYMDPYSNQPMVTVTVPMHKNNKFYGVSTVDLKLEGLQTVLAKASTQFGGYAFAVDRNGKLLSFPYENQTSTVKLTIHDKATGDFITLSELSSKHPDFDPLIQPVLKTISEVIDQTDGAEEKIHDLAQKIANDSYQIDIKEASLIAALLTKEKYNNSNPEVNFRQLYLNSDAILGEAAYATIYEMPGTYWKIITVMPYSKAIETSNVIYQSVITYISIAMLVSFIIMLLLVRKFIVKPLSRMSRQLQILHKADKNNEDALEIMDSGELGNLAFWFNKRSTKLLDIQNELRETQNELEQRVHERTEELQVEIDNRIKQQSTKEEWALRVERQHAAVFELSLHKSLYSGDITEAAKIINKTAAQVLNVARTSIWLLNEAGEQMQVVDLYDSITDTHSHDAVLKLTDYPAYFKALEIERSIAVYDMFADERTVDLIKYAETFNVSSLLDSPIRVAGKLRGIICFEQIGEKREWHNDEMRFGGEIADQFYQVIANSERICSDDKIRKLAFYDPLTDLANRRFLQETLQHEIDIARRNKKYGILLYLDLDNFKTLNDSLGHTIGDELLVQLSRRLKNTLRKEDMAARLGGDEFVILLTGEHADKEQAMEQALSVANKIQTAISKSYRLHGFEHIITASIGITVYPDKDTTVTELLKQADTAMYRAKDEGRNTISFYNIALQKAADKRLLVEKELRHAIANDQFEMYYQPQVDVYGNLVGTEALIRWKHPERGIISPLDFIPIAEETGLILELGNWILKDACEFSKKCNLNLLAINISPRQFRHPDFVKIVKNIIDTTKADPGVLMLEVTEGIVIDNIEDTIEKMNALKNIGIRFAIDDFGTGYSSLAYLKQLPLDQLKINDKFVRDVITDTSDAIIVETIILMARNLGLNVVAEGVETSEQLEFLVNEECHIFQGFLFSYPLTKHDFSQYLRQPRLNQPTLSETPELH